jgi:hypothetical protein
MAYGFTSTQVGFPEITDSALPVTVETIGSTVVTNVTVPLGTVVRAKDPAYGEGEFIRLLGVASTVVGSLVKYNATTYQTALLNVANGRNAGVPVAVAMSANTAGKHGWYQISGNAVIKKTTVAVTPQVRIFISGTDGRMKVLASAGQQILGAQTANLTTIVTTTSTVVVTINRPFTQGQIT